MQIFKKKTNFDFMGKRKLTVVLSLTSLCSRRPLLLLWSCPCQSHPNPQNPTPTSSYPQIHMTLMQGQKSNVKYFSYY